MNYKEIKIALLRKDLKEIEIVRRLRREGWKVNDQEISRAISEKNCTTPKLKKIREAIEKMLAEEGEVRGEGIDR